VAGLGEVKIDVGLNTAPAEAQLTSFFGKIGNQQVKDPLKGLDKSFGKTAEQAKKLGFEWDSTTKKFKSDQGFTQTVDQMNKTLKNLGGTTKKSAQDFDNLAKRVKGSADQWKFLTGGAQQLQQQLSGVSSSAQKTSKDLQGLGKGDSLKTVSGSSKTAATNIKLLGTSVQTTNNQLKGLGGGAKQGLDGIGASAKTAGTSINGLSKGAQTLGSAFVSLGKQKPLVPIATSLKTLSTQVPGVAQKFTTLGQSVAKAGQGTQFRTLGQQLNSLVAPAQNAAKGVDGLEKEFKEAGQQGQTFSGQIQQGFQQILQGIPTGIGIAIGQQLLAPLQQVTQIIPAAVAEFRALEESISLTVAIINGSAAEFSALSESILKVSSNSAATAQEVGGVAQSLARAGFSLQEIDAALAGVVNGAEATGTSYEAMGQIVVNALGAYGLAAEEAGTVSDSLTVAANNSNQSVTDLGEALKYVGPIAAATGQDLNDTALALQLLADSGIRGSQAGTSFRTILTNLQIAASGAGEEFMGLSRGSARLEKALKLIGANMTDANGELLTGADLIKELQRSMEGLSNGEKALVSKALAGSEGLPALNTLISASGEKVDELADKLENSAGAAADATAKALSGLSGSFKLLQSNISAFLVQIGGVIATVLKPLVDLVTAVISGFNNLPGPIKNVITVLALLAAGIAAVNVAMVALQAATTSAFGQKVTAAVAQFATTITQANISGAISGWIGSIGTLASTLNKNMIKGLGLATEAILKFRKQLVDVASKGFSTFMSAIQGISFKDFTSGVKQAAIAIKTKMVAAMATGKGAAAGLAAAFGPLVASIGAFLVAAAPFIAIAGAIAGAIILIKRNVDSYNAVAKPLKKSTETLTKSMKDTAEGAKDAGEGFKSWGDRIFGILGPFDKFFSMLIPGYKLVKDFLNILGNVENWARNQSAILAANNAQAEFQRELDKSNAKIEANRQALASGTLSQAEANRALAENGKLIRAQQEAMDQRIGALDQQIKKLKEDEAANKDTIQTLERLKGEYIAQKAVIDANAAALKEERIAYDEQNQTISDYIGRLNDAKEARGQIEAQNVANSYQNELDALKAVTDGLITKEEAQARVATVTKESIDKQIEAEQDLMEANEAAYSRMLITQEEYDKVKAQSTEKIKELLREQAVAENELSEATTAAINRRLSDMEKEITQIEANAGRASSALQGIFTIQGSAIGAFKNLAQQVTTLEITRADNVQQKRLENIDKEEKARLKMIEKSSLSDEQKDRAKERAQQDFQKQRDSAEREFEAKRKAALSEQIALEAQMNAANYVAKNAELQLWYTQQQIQLQIQATQAEINKQRAIAEGDDKAVAAYNKQLELINLQQQQLPKVLQMKQEILRAEEDAEGAALANKAAAEGLSESLARYAVPTLDEVKSRFASISAIGDDLAGAWDGFQTSAEEIPSDVEGVVQKVKTNIDSINDASFDRLRQAFIDRGLNPGVAEEMARGVVATYEAAGAEAGDKAAKNIYDRFGESVPKQLIKDQLLEAFQQGSQLSAEAAKKKFNELPDLVPKEQVAKAIGAGFGEGAQKGIDVLKNTPLPDGMLAAIQAEEEWEQVAEAYVDYLGEPSLLDKAGQAIADWWNGAEKSGDIQKAGESGAKEYASGIEDNTDVKESVGTQFEEGTKEGVSAARTIVKQEAPEIGKDFADGVSGALRDNAEAMAAAITTEVEKAKGAFQELANAVDTSKLETAMNKAVVEPVNKAKQALEGLSGGEQASQSFRDMASAAQTIAQQNLNQIYSSVSRDSRSASTASRSLASAMRSASSSARSYASSMERAARAAAAAARSKWTGGPVQSGQTYTVNELGKEMFMSSSGKLSEINAPAFGSWRAPSSGTVIPAGMAQQIRNQRDAIAASTSAASMAGGGSAMAAMSEGPSLSGAIARGFKGIGPMGNNQVVNNVNVSSDRPVNDASRILTDLARIRAQRRR